MLIIKKKQDLYEIIENLCENKTFVTQEMVTEIIEYAKSNNLLSDKIDGKWIYNALLSSSAKEVVNFNNVLRKLIKSNERI